MTNLQRRPHKGRIAKKTQLAMRLGKAVAKIRLNTVSKMEEMSLTCSEAFSLFLTGRGGTINKQEFHQGLAGEARCRGQ
jgi:hypothetical protein